MSAFEPSPLISRIGAPSPVSRTKSRSPRTDSIRCRRLPLVVAMVAFELYGLGGALYGLAIAVFAAAVLDELAPTDADSVDLGELEKPLS